ncbi:hypothetical protein H632_c2861p0, partial [Helicosporidium sp. ATCC 50920]
RVPLASGVQAHPAQPRVRLPEQCTSGARLVRCSRRLAPGGEQDVPRGFSDIGRGSGAHPAHPRRQVAGGRHHDPRDAGGAAPRGRRTVVRRGAVRRRAQHRRRVELGGARAERAGAGGAAPGHGLPGPGRHVCDQGFSVARLRGAAVRPEGSVRPSGREQAPGLALHVGGDLRRLPRLQGAFQDRPPPARPQAPVQGGRGCAPARRRRRAAAQLAQARAEPRGLRRRRVLLSRRASRRRVCPRRQRSPDARLQHGPRPPRRSASERLRRQGPGPLGGSGGGGRGRGRRLDAAEVHSGQHGRHRSRRARAGGRGRLRAGPPRHQRRDSRAVRGPAGPGALRVQEAAQVAPRAARRPLQGGLRPAQGARRRGGREGGRRGGGRGLRGGGRPRTEAPGRDGGAAGKDNARAEEGAKEAPRSAAQGQGLGGRHVRGGRGGRRRRRGRAVALLPARLSRRPGRLRRRRRGRHREQRLGAVRVGVVRRRRALGRLGRLRRRARALQPLAGPPVRARVRRDARAPRE